jgi:dipeptidyl aminopeptidase/acylaminoacyl peptidase
MSIPPRAGAVNARGDYHPAMPTPGRAITPGLPSTLAGAARWVRPGETGVPAMLVHPDWAGGEPRPTLLWMHGRTAHKEIDPGRFLRLLRAGFAACAVDLPGHGERFEATLQYPERTLDVIRQMIEEIDGITAALAEFGVFDMDRLAIGGMSAGGMAALARLARPHRFTAGCVEAASGSWEHQRHREMFRGRRTAEIAADNPLANLDGWREIPLQAIHTRADEWVAFDGQAAFVDALRARYEKPDLVDFVVYDETGAPYEHAGFGAMSADAKNRQRDFLGRVWDT